MSILSTSFNPVIGDVLNNRVIVTPSNAASTLGGTIDSTKEYFLDGIIDCTGFSIEVPSGGLTIKGYNFDVSKLVCSDSTYTMFTSPAGGSGNVLFTDIAIEVTGTSSQVFDLVGDTGFEAIEFNRVNWNDCTSMGEIDTYRQGLESGTGRFGGTPELTLTGTWTGGWFIDTSIVRSLTAGSYSLYKAGTAFVMNSRFRSNQNIDLPASASFFDFTNANFTNPSTLQLVGCIITRNGVSDSTDALLTPNIDYFDLECAWIDNQGISNTFIGGRLDLTAEIETTINTLAVYETLAGTWTASDLQHFDSPANGQLRHLGNDPKDYSIIGSFVIVGGANDQVEVRLMRYDSSATTTAEIGTPQNRQINALSGARNVGFYTIIDDIQLDTNDYVFWEVRNNTDTTNITLELNSYFIIKER